MVKPQYNLYVALPLASKITKVLVNDGRSHHHVAKQIIGALEAKLSAMTLLSL